MGDWAAICWQRRKIDVAAEVGHWPVEGTKDEETSQHTVQNAAEAQ